MITEFCHDGFWNSTSFANVKYPIFTECFQYVILLIPSGIFIVLLSMFFIFKRYKSHPIIKVPCNFYYGLKLCTQALIIILLIMEIILEKALTKSNSRLDGLCIISYVVLCIILVLAMLQTEIRRRTMHPVCSILFVFWLTITIGYLLRLYCNIIRLLNTSPYNIRAGLIFLSVAIFLLVTLNFLTHCFSSFSEDRLVLPNKTPCPEVYASILSKLTYSWLDVYIYRWFRKEMTDETSFDLRREDESTKNTNLLEKIFHDKIKITHNPKRSDLLQNSTASVAHLMEDEDKLKNPSNRSPGWVLFLSLARVYGPQLIIACIFKTVHDFSIYAMPFLLKILLDYIQKRSDNYWIGYFLAIAFLFFGVISSLAENACFFITSILSIRMRAALIGMIYRKTLRLNSEIRGKFTSGEIVNLMSVDAERIMNWTTFAWFFLSCPLQIVLAIILLYREMSYAIFAGLGLIIAFFPLNGLLMNFMQKYSTIELKWKDLRIKVLTEILNGIKVLKMYAWEKSFLDKITGLRDTEMKYIFKVSAALAFVCILWEILPFLIMLATFLSYVFSNSHNIITPEKAFVSLTLFNLLRFPMVILPWGLTDSMNAFVSLKRIGEYLVGEELNLTDINHRDYTDKSAFNHEPAIEIRDGSFSWKKEDKLTLNNINIEIARGKLIAIVGKVGTGKSSLISAILGEMHKMNGSVSVQGTIAYVSQEAWIQNKSLKENILFTQKYNEKFYTKIIEACALKSDLEQLPGGDETEIGERGINLSGGQKQRISLARAVYQNRDIYLFDDPLSAVDAHVGEHLFENVISNNGILKDKTRILVTHGLNWLPKVDEVLVLDSNGSISERGSFKELLKDCNEFMQFVHEYIEHNNRTKNPSVTKHLSDESTLRKAKNLLRQLSDNEDAIEEFTDFVLTTPAVPIPRRDSRKVSSASDKLSSSISKSIDSFSRHVKYFENSNSGVFEDEDPKSPRLVRSSSQSRQISRDSDQNTERLIDKPISQLIEEEQAMSGTVKWATYSMCIKSRGLLLFIATVFIYAIFTGLQVFSNIWLKNFTEDSDIQNASQHISMNVSGSTYWSMMLRQRTQYYMLIYGMIGLSMTLVVGFYWAFFTVGSINASKVIHKKLLRSVLRSPMEFFDTTPSGRIINRFSKDMENSDHLIPMNISDALNCLFIVFASIIVIIYVTPWFIIAIIPLAALYYLIQLFYIPTSRQSRRLDSIAASPVFNHFTETLQGVALIRAFKEQQYFQNLNQILIDKSSKFKFIQQTSVRWLSLRIEILGQLMVFAAVLFSIISRFSLTASLVGLSISYSLQITEFLNWLLRQYTELETNCVALERIREYSKIPSEAEWNLDNPPSESWPNDGNITFKDYDLRYRDGLPLVLKNINLHLHGGKKIGVVGRTGAGKSSLNLALFRLVEAAGGSITIDNINISEIGLHDLRKRLTILPQDPVIFSGTLRENLDPFCLHRDEEIFQSLETAHLKLWVSALSEGLDYECGEGGVNLSSGQKQLLCLARALLRKSKVLILDEATASVDVETDRLVMQTIREYFHQSTVIIIAHRINTILDTDIIVVMENGEIIEMDSPKNLLEMPNGVFKSLHDQSSKNDL